VFKDVRTRIEDLISMKDDPETADEAIDIDGTIISGLSELEDMTSNEIKCASLFSNAFFTLV
jgi:ubiquitin carboxyl-terminal hydrolase 25/28